jgi:aminoglycoside phosphotransferase (APT) family kinase protein
MIDLPDIILGALQRRGLVERAAGWRVALAPGGTTDRTFSVTDPHGRPVLTVRLARPGFGDWLRREESVLREIGAEGTCRVPSQVTRIEDAELPEGQMLVHGHVDGAPRSLSAMGDGALKALADSLAWVHGHPRAGYMIWPALDVRQGTRGDCFRARLDSLRRYECSRGALPDFDNLLRRIEAIELPPSAGWDEPGFALTHGDLSAGNILWTDDGRVSLIDWEFCRDGDPAEDIAYLIADQDLSPDIVADLADAYASASGDPWALARIPAWLPLVAVDSALWWADYFLRHGQPIEHSNVSSRIMLGWRYLGA